MLFILIVIFVLVAFYSIKRKAQDEFLESYTFPEMIIEKFKEKHTSLSDEDIALVIKGLKNYFYISSHSRDIIIMPSIVLTLGARRWKSTPNTKIQTIKEALSPYFLSLSHQRQQKSFLYLLSV